MRNLSANTGNPTRFAERLFVKLDNAAGSMKGIDPYAKRKLAPRVGINPNARDSTKSGFGEGA